MEDEPTTAEVERDARRPYARHQGSALKDEGKGQEHYAHPLPLPQRQCRSETDPGEKGQH